MITFDKIAREAGVCTRPFPALKDIKVYHLYDEDNNTHQSDDVKYIQPLFADNPDSFEKFFNFVSDLDANPDCMGMDIQITPEYVVVFYKTPNARVFRRTQPLDPLDYAD